MRHRRKGKKSNAQQKLDREFSRLVREKGRCERCGRNGDLGFDTAHVVGRSNLALRWDIMNVLCLCRRCHRWGHDHPTEFANWFSRKFPGRNAYIKEHKNKITSWGLSDYEEMLALVRDRNLSGLALWL